MNQFPTHKELQEIPYEVLAPAYYYENPLKFLIQLGAKVSSGEITNLTIQHPNILNQVKGVDPGWTFMDIMAIVEGREAFLGVTLQQLRVSLGSVQEPALMHTLLCYALLQNDKTRIYMHKYAPLLAKGGVLYQERWFTNSELENVFDMHTSSTISTASRGVNTYRGFYITRRESTEQERAHYSRASGLGRLHYLYRPCSLEEKVKQLAHLNWSTQKLSQSLGLSENRILDIIQDPHTEFFNPFDFTTHDAYFNVEGLVEILKNDQDLSLFDSLDSQEFQSSLEFKEDPKTPGHDPGPCVATLPEELETPCKASDAECRVSTPQQAYKKLVEQTTILVNHLLASGFEVNSSAIRKTLGLQEDLGTWLQILHGLPQEYWPHLL